MTDQPAAAVLQNAMTNVRVCDRDQRSVGLTVVPQVRRLQQDVQAIVRAATSSEASTSSATDFEAAAADALAAIKVGLLYNCMRPHITLTPGTAAAACTECC